jgi:hypothetical protein
MGGRAHTAVKTLIDAGDLGDVTAAVMTLLESQAIMKAAP